MKRIAFNDNGADKGQCHTSKQCSLRCCKYADVGTIDCMGPSMELAHPRSLVYCLEIPYMQLSLQLMQSKVVGIFVCIAVVSFLIEGDRCMRNRKCGPRVETSESEPFECRC